MKSKIDFTKDKLKAIVLELANLQGYQNPSTYLDELLNEVKQFNSFEFECDFFLNIHYLCKENSEKFWSEAHRKDITQWLGKARILTDVFKTTWDGLTKDTRYSLAKFYKNLPKAKYEMMKSQIEKDGYFILREENKKNDFKIYTTELAFVFLSNEITVDNLDTKTVTKIKSWEYFNTYIESYKKGEQYFENEFKISPNIIYGANGEEYVEGIHKNYFYVQHIEGFDGWGYVKKNYPIILTHNAVKEFGYYSGIVNKVEEQVKKYPLRFATFDKFKDKEKFKTFEELFDYAVMVGSISVPETNIGRQNAKHLHNFNFNVWLQNFKGWEYGIEKTYIENLTRENWVEYLMHCNSEQLQQMERAEKIASNWKPEAIHSQQNETKIKQGQPTFTNNFDNINTTEIYKHFKAGLVDKNYLTEHELNEYLIAAFELKTKPETLFKIKTYT
jgi:hypothetical protein